MSSIIYLSNTNNKNQWNALFWNFNLYNSIIFLNHVVYKEKIPLVRLCSRIHIFCSPLSGCFWRCKMADGTHLCFCFYLIPDHPDKNLHFKKGATRKAISFKTDIEKIRHRYYISVVDPYPHSAAGDTYVQNTSSLWWICCRIFNSLFQGYNSYWWIFLWEKQIQGIFSPYMVSCIKF